MNLQEAMKKHAEWRIRLRTAIIKKEKLDTVALATDNRCELGIWLHGDAKLKLGNNPIYANCVKAHAAFHKAVAEVASASNKGQYADAEKMMGAGSAFSQESNNVGMALMALDQVVRSAT